jgi:hypothetical protein
MTNARDGALDNFSWVETPFPRTAGHEVKTAALGMLRIDLRCLTKTKKQNLLHFQTHSKLLRDVLFYCDH